MIKIGKDYRLNSDGICVSILKRSINKKTGKESWNAKWFYANYTQALEGLIDRKINGAGIRDLEYIVDLIEKLKSEIREALC